MRRAHHLVVLVLVGALLLDGVVSACPHSRAFPDTRFATGNHVSIHQVGRVGCRVLGGQELKSTNSGRASVLFFVGLGRVGKGEVEEIALRQSRITADTYSPDVLGFPVVPRRKTVELIPDQTRPQRTIDNYIVQPLRQIKVPEALVDIIILTRWEYELRYYHPNQIGPKVRGAYMVSGAPYSVTNFRNPNPPHTNRLAITTFKDGREEQSEYVYDETVDSWSFLKNGMEVVRKESTINPNNPCERIETRYDLKEGTLFKTIRVFKAFPWGQNIVKEVEDPDGEARVTTYTYFEDRIGAHYSFLKTTIHPDGRIERHNQQPDPTVRSRKP